MNLAPSITPVTIVSAASSLVAPLAAGHKAGLVPASWSANYKAIPTLDLLWRCSATCSVTLARVYEWYLRAKTFADSTFTTTFADNTLTDTSHGLRAGTGPVYLSSDDTLPDGLTAATPYWIIYVDANTVKLAASLADALQETAVEFDDDGTGTHTMADDPLGTVDADAGITKEPTASAIGLLGDEGDGAFTLGVGLGYSVPVLHRYEVVAYSVQATLSAGNVTVEMLPRGEY